MSFGRGTLNPIGPGGRFRGLGPPPFRILALQGAGRALTDCRLPVFGRASENQGLRWGSLAHRPGLGRGRGRASIGPTEKRREAVKGRVAAKRSDVYPLRRPLFCETGRGQRSEGATKGAGPDQGLSWEAEHRPSADGGRAWGGGPGVCH